MSYNTAEFNYFPHDFGVDYSDKQKPRGQHPLYHLKVGESYTATDQNDYRGCFNRTHSLKRAVFRSCVKRGYSLELNNQNDNTRIPNQP
jgi:hypothetical protein